MGLSCVVAVGTGIGTTVGEGVGIVAGVSAGDMTTGASVAVVVAVSSGGSSPVDRSQAASTKATIMTARQRILFKLTMTATSS